MKAVLRTLFLAILCSVAVSAQTKKNVLLDREYWKAAPEVSKIESDIKSGNNPAEMTSAGFDATVYAILEKAPDASVHYLLTQPGNDVNKITHDGRTYIFWAAYVGNTDLMQYLQSKGAKTDIIEDHGYTIANFAASTGQT
ncbi:MAG: ankyrin repeat domain-containing protein, partial [Proteobacteria bacterium]